MTLSLFVFCVYLCFIVFSYFVSLRYAFTLANRVPVFLNRRNNLLLNAYH